MALTVRALAAGRSVSVFWRDCILRGVGSRPRVEDLAGERWVQASRSWLLCVGSQGKRVERLSDQTVRSSVWLIRCFLFLMEGGSWERLYLAERYRA